MEVEFDKEIDAILRRARPSRGVLVGDDPPKKHIDADALAAFAENALPQRTRLLYVEHLSDCDRCRMQLSRAILSNGEEMSVATAVAREPVVVAAAAPWYTRVFRTPNLAIAMGALVLTFSGVLGYLVLQNRESKNATISQAPRTVDTQGEPYFGGQAASNADIAAPLATPPGAGLAANQPMANTAAPLAESGSTLPTAGEARRAEADSLKALGVDEDAKEAPAKAGARPPEVMSAPAPPPPPPAAVTTDGLLGGVREKKAAADKQEAPKDDLELAKRKYSEESRSRDQAPAASKMGPSRSGPIQNQMNHVQTNKLGEMAVTRSVSGKTFSNRDGAWYDRKYTGQATTNIRRGTDEFNKLDRGLRNIANELGGVVVVVWKDKAYRIQ